MRITVYIKMPFRCWLYRHSRRYREKMDRESDEYFAIEQAAAGQEMPL